MKKITLWICSGIAFCLFSYLLGCGGGGGGGGGGGTPIANDLDLYLYNANRELVDYSEGVGSTETVQTSAAGEYYIGIEPWSGASNYILSIGRSDQSSQIDANADFVPGDVVIAFKDDAALHHLGEKTSRGLTVFGMTPRSGIPGRAQVYHFDSRDTKQVMDTIGIEQSDHTLSGTIIATSNSLIDSDVNDPNAPYASNDTADNAQPLPNPVILGGYANTVYSGERGRSYEIGDLVDYFRVSLTENQTIQLYVADVESSDANSNITSSSGNSTKLDAELIQLKRDTLRVIQELNKREDVLFAEPNYYRRAYFTPNDTHYYKQWHYPQINLPQAWEITRGKSSVVVAVIDTGILSQHPDFENQLTDDGYDFISDTEYSLDGNGMDDNPEDPGDQSQGGSSFHGTHVAGTVAAATHNSTGVAGVAGNVKIMALRSLGKGGTGFSSDIREAIYYAAGLQNSSGALPNKKADIINMSLGGGGFSIADKNAIDAARNAGVIIIAAAGNESTSLGSYPAAYDGVVSVSSVDANKDLAPYSNYGTTIDVAAPGGDISEDTNGDGNVDGVFSTRGNDTSGNETRYVYSFLQGTSMACPHMAGVAALMKSVNTDFTPANLDSWLISGSITEDIGDTGKDDSFGYGLIDAYKAVIQAQGGTIPAYLFVNPSSLNFGSATESITLTAEKSGDEDLTIQSVTSDAGWLEINEDTVDTDKLGTYIASVNRTDLADGPYYATITFTSDANQVLVDVTMYQGDISSTGDLGFHYVLLVDMADEIEVVDQDETSSSNGLSYSFSNVASGTYSIYAGTDSDNDGYIGDAGEAIGAYFSLDQPAEIDVSSDLSSLDFVTSFNFNLPAGSTSGLFYEQVSIRRMDMQ